MNDIFQILLGFITGGGLLTVVTYKSTRTKANADAMKAVQDVYQETIRDLRQEKELLKKEIFELRNEIQEIKIQIKRMEDYDCIVKNCAKRIRSINKYKENSINNEENR